MKNNPDTADIWVIHESHALLFRQHEGQDKQEMRMPFNTFVGSATALASFSLPDTRVYLNLGPAQSDQTGNYKAGQDADKARFWAGLAKSPTRLLALAAEDWQLEILSALKSMGKKAEAISVSNVMHFRQATNMILVNQQEMKHLEAALQQVKSGSGKYRAALQLVTALWLRPHCGYQKLRCAVACGIMLGALAVSGTIQHQAGLQQKKLALPATGIQKTDYGSSQASTPAPFSEWIEQLRKFGQENRANLLSINLFWTDKGQIHTQVELDRERKRVPKGCKLTGTNQAACTTGRNDQ
ncbi:MAG TPA: hypothetical protein VFV28_03355 [Limnobacter sp.]|nr:hypothetical protein [Limnobacter sp.]